MLREIADEADPRRRYSNCSTFQKKQEHPTVGLFLCTSLSAVSLDEEGLLETADTNHATEVKANLLPCRAAEREDYVAV